MRVLLTGIAGFIGSHVFEHLLKETDWEIVGIASFRHKGDSLRLELDAYDPDRVRIFYHDLCGPLSERLIYSIGAVDYVINVASESHVDRSITDPVPFVENNVSLVLNMLEYARAVKPKAFVQVSTDEVYGAAAVGHAHKEWETVLPSNPYSASKAAQEAIAISYWRTYGVPVIITNTMNNFGERQDAEKFVPMVIRKLYHRERVTIHGTRKFIGSRYYLHARNHADAILHILNRTSPVLFPAADRPDRYNVVGNREVNNLEMARMIASLMGRRLRYKLEDFHSTRPGHDPRYALDGGFMRDVMHWEPPVPLEESLERTIQWTLAHKEWL